MVQSETTYTSISKSTKCTQCVSNLRIIQTQKENIEQMREQFQKMLNRPFMQTPTGSKLHYHGETYTCQHVGQRKKEVDLCSLCCSAMMADLEASRSS